MSTSLTLHDSITRIANQAIKDITPRQAKICTERIERFLNSLITERPFSHGAEIAVNLLNRPRKGENGVIYGISDKEVWCLAYSAAGHLDFDGTIPDTQGWEINKQKLESVYDAYVSKARKVVSNIDATTSDLCAKLGLKRPSLIFFSFLYKNGGTEHFVDAERFFVTRGKAVKDAILKMVTGSECFTIEDGKYRISESAVEIINR